MLTTITTESSGADTMAMSDIALPRLLQLSSAALPVGGYAFSQGLEYAIDSGWVADRSAVHSWLGLQLQESMAQVDLPLLLRMIQAVTREDLVAVEDWNACALACRETAELRLTDTAMGEALFKLLEQLDVPLSYPPGYRRGEQSFISGFAMAAVHWQLDSRSACHGYLWSWLENQVAAATKLVPLGQTAAQQLLGQLLPMTGAAIDRALLVADEDIGASLPGQAMASAWHETQYSRLFRS